MWFVPGDLVLLAVAEFLVSVHYDTNEPGSSGVAGPVNYHEAIPVWAVMPTFPGTEFSLAVTWTLEAGG